MTFIQVIVGSIYLSVWTKLHSNFPPCFAHLQSPHWTSCLPLTDSRAPIHFNAEGPISGGAGRGLGKTSSTKYSQSRSFAVTFHPGFGAAAVASFLRLSAGVWGRICRIQPQHLFRGPLVWELPPLLFWFLSFSCLIIFFILTIRPRCFAFLIFLLLPPTVCCSPPPPPPPPAERGISFHSTTSHHCPFLCCCCSGFQRALLGYYAEGFIFVLISTLHPVHSGHRHFFSLRDVLPRVEVCALNRGEY